MVIIAAVLAVIIKADSLWPWGTYYTVRSPPIPLLALLGSTLRYLRPGRISVDHRSQVFLIFRHYLPSAAGWRKSDWAPLLRLYHRTVALDAEFGLAWRAAPVAVFCWPA